MNRRQSGFTLIEAFVVVLILGLAATAYTRFRGQSVMQERASRAAVQIQTIQDAAYTFLLQNGTWPDEANACAGSLASLVTAGFLISSPATSPWGTTYTTVCTGGTRFDVAVDTGAQIWAEYLQNYLGIASRAGNVVTSGLPRSGLAGGGDTSTLLSRVEDPTAPERNRMETDIDMNGNDLRNAATVEAGGSALNASAGGTLELGAVNNTTAGTGTPSIDFHLSGLTEDFNVRITNEADGVLALISDNLRVSNNLTAVGTITAADVITTNGVKLSEQAQQMLILPLNGNAAQGACVPKPANCPAGTQEDIYVVPSVFSMNDSGLPMVAVQPLVNDNDGAPNCGTGWEVNARITVANSSQAPAEPDSTYGRLLVITRCAPNV